jgi:hypothetical protein
MRIELDHMFICTTPGAPEAEQLVRFGLHEGTPNRHPGQGTANRRFTFANAMIELALGERRNQAQSESTRRTGLWQRWLYREGTASPFGICLRPIDSQNSDAPFSAWEYRPSYLPDPLVMHIGQAPIEEPMWVYLGFQRKLDHEQRFVEHPAGLREITGVILTSPMPLYSTAAQKVSQALS